MHIARIQVVNFRCLKDLSMTLDDFTVLGGANGIALSEITGRAARQHDPGHVDHGPRHRLHSSGIRRWSRS